MGTCVVASMCRCVSFQVARPQPAPTARRQRLLLHYARRTLRLSLTRIAREPPALLAAALPLETARAALREPPAPQDPAR